MQGDQPRGTDQDGTNAMNRGKPAARIGRPRLDRGHGRERDAHNAKLAAWSMILKTVGYFCWAGGAVAIIAYLVAITTTARLMAEVMKNVPNHLIGPVIVIQIIVMAIIVFASGAAFWAASLVLTSMGHIEENTRISAASAGRDDEPTK
jgi:hypothetical protein